MGTLGRQTQQAAVGRLRVVLRRARRHAIDNLPLAAALLERNTCARKSLSDCRARLLRKVSATCPQATRQEHFGSANARTKKIPKKTNLACERGGHSLFKVSAQLRRHKNTVWASEALLVPILRAPVAPGNLCSTVACACCANCARNATASNTERKLWERKRAHKKTCEQKPKKHARAKGEDARLQGTANQKSMGYDVVLFVRFCASISCFFCHANLRRNVRIS